MPVLEYTKKRRKSRTYYKKAITTAVISITLLVTLMIGGYIVYGDKLFPKEIPAVKNPEAEVPVDRAEPQVTPPDPSAGEPKYLLLASKDNPLPDGYTPKNLIRIPGYIYQMDEAAANALSQLLIDMKSEGITGMEVKSAYRTYTKQKQLFENKVKQYTPNYATLEEARAAAAQIVAIPGTSEHQTGLAADVSNMPSLEESFGDTKAGKWLAQHASEYGFIIRYPKDKTDITGIVYEPWHLRYVGKEAAAYITENGLCLEEYLESINQVSTEFQ